jgi:hypothetical protein
MNNLTYKPHESSEIYIKLRESYMQVPCSGGLVVW